MGAIAPFFLDFDIKSNNLSIGLPTNKVSGFIINKYSPFAYFAPTLLPTPNPFFLFSTYLTFGNLFLRPVTTVFTSSLSTTIISNDVFGFEE